MRVLICVNNKKMQRSIEKWVARDKTIIWVIDVAVNGEEAVFNAREIDYRLILIDLWLEEEGSFDIISKIRLSKVQTPIIVFEKMRDVFNKIFSLEAGGDAYLTLTNRQRKLEYLSQREQRTLDFQELKAVAFSLTQRDFNTVKKTVTFGNASYDFVRKSLEIDRKQIVLTGFETRMIDFLCQNKGKVLTRNDIFDGIYKEEALESLDSITVLIFKLRKKIGENSKYIRNIRGVGYVLD